MFKQVVYINKDPSTKNPVLKEGYGKNGRKFLSGKVFWKNGIKPNDKTNFKTMKFAAYGNAINVIKQYPNDMLEFEGKIEKCEYVSRDGKDIVYDKFIVFEARQIARTPKHWEDKDD